MIKTAHPVAVTPRVAVDITADELAESVSADTFKSAFRLHPAGVAVVTGDPGGSPFAMTVSSLASVSTEPPMLVFSASALSSSTPALEQSDTVVVHMVGNDQLWLAKLGATSGIDRFADTASWTRLATGEPVFPSVYAWLRGRIVQRIEAGNSVICVVHIIEASVPEPGQHVDDPSRPLVYHARTWHHLGDHSALS
jgi:flavin reductase (DIM6/NTAB) family NADH-FMN oxidoreductase RutF